MVRAQIAKLNRPASTFSSFLRFADFLCCLNFSISSKFIALHAVHTPAVCAVRSASLSSIHEAMLNRAAINFLCSFVSF